MILTLIVLFLTNKNKIITRPNSNTSLFNILFRDFFFILNKKYIKY